MYSNIESILGNSVYDTVIYGFVLRAYPKTKQKKKQKFDQLKKKRSSETQQDSQDTNKTKITENSD